ncbi:DnaJ-domain-containing protein [Fistulina hepatica ATCC 64428]|nr:DnaJ-domain-containing protein [Fistulina hepatica ATCC 64428]
MSASTSKDVETYEDIEKLLSREASAFQREFEVDRILKAFKLNPYDILDISESCTADDIKKRYRQLSLFIHPDKCPHPRAPEAFDIVKKAESELSDKAKREELDAVIHQARLSVLKSLELPPSTTDSDPQLRLVRDPPFKVRLRAESKEMLIEEELRRRKAIKMNLANEGHEARKKDEEVASKKRKAEEDKAWEETREQRVDSWRSFSHSKKKKKTKPSLLG